MTSAYRYRTLFLLLGMLLTLGVTAGFVFLRYAPSNTVTLPIEVIGPDGYTQTVTVVGSNASQAQHVYLQAHSIGYPYYEDFAVDKASIRINGGPWTDITNDVATCQFPESNLDCVGGPYPTIRFEIPVADIGGSLQDGSNTIDFRFNYAFSADSPDDFGSASTGYRILDLELRDGGDFDLIDGTTFVWDDPATWTPPAGYDDPQSVSEGETLWHQRDILIDGWSGPAIRASCADCHAADGRDLQYFAYSNASIIARSAFHGLTDDEGKKIAAYIRSQELQDVDNGHTYAPPARPWTPVYQPGPTNRASRGEDADRTFGTPLENMPSNGSQYWAAGAGLEWTLDSDMETLPHLFPGGVSYDDIDPESSLDVWNIPVALQYADWNEWLPVHHPLDMWGDDFVGTSIWETYYGPVGGGHNGLPNMAEFIQCWEQNGNDGSCHDNVQWIIHFLWERTTVFEKSGAFNNFEPGFTYMNHNNHGAFSRSNIRRWANVKMWELVHTYDLADEQIDGDAADLLQWPSGRFNARGPFQNPPHLVGRYAGSGSGSWDLWLDNMWYDVGLRIQHGRDAGVGIRPLDLKYQHMHMSGIEDFGISQDLRFVTSFVKNLQSCEAIANPPGNLGVPRGWFNRPGHCNFGLTPRGFGTGFVSSLEEQQPGLGLSVYETILQGFVEVMMYKHSPLTYDQNTGDFTGDVDANWRRESGEQGWEPDSYTPTFDAPSFGASHTPSHYLKSMNIMASYGARPTLLDSAAVWLDAMNPSDLWDDYRCESNGGARDCASSVNEPPTISLTTPTGGTTLTDPSSITLEADASDPDGSVATVAFFADDTKIGEASEAPFAYTWNDPAPGTYSLTARATDNDGLTTTSAAVSVTIEASGESTTTQAIPLASGWNLISSRVAPDPSDLTTVFDGVTNVVVVQDDQGNEFIPSESVNTIGSWDPNEGYMVHVMSADTLTMDGQSINPDATISLSEGWNVMPYYPSTALSVSEALTSISSELVMLKDLDGRSYIPSYGVDQVGSLQPGQAYKVFVSSATELTYPSSTSTEPVAAASTESSLRTENAENR